MKGFYDLDLRDTGEGVALTVRRKEEFCTYTRELTVDLPDLDGADLTDQGDEEYCENCGRPMVLKKGRFGTFFACSEYPDCKTTKQIGGTQTKDVPLDEKCPQCDSNLVMKYGRFGEFTACSNYPTCKYVKQKTIGVKCPECSEGEIIERRSKKGKTFYGCNRYPDCTFVAWGKPVPEKCTGVRQPVHGREVGQGGRLLAVPEPRVQTQSRGAGGRRGHCPVSGPVTLKLVYNGEDEPLSSGVAPTRFTFRRSTPNTARFTGLATNCIRPCWRAPLWRN